MAQDFPNNPIVGELFTQGISRFEWNGTAWNYLGPTSDFPQNITFTNKVSARANAGTYVQMDDFAWTMWTSGNRSLVVKYMGGPSILIRGTTNGTVSGGYVGGLTYVNCTYNTPAYVASGYSFGVAGSVQEYYFVADVGSYNFMSYRVTMQVGWGYLNNIITIEKYN